MKKPWIERPTYGPLLLSLCLLVSIYGFVTTEAVLHYSSFAFAFVLIGAIKAISHRSSHVIVGTVLAVPGFLLRIAPVAFQESASITIAANLFTTTLMFYVAIIILYNIQHAHKVTADTLAGAVCVYMLIGMCFTLIFVSMEIANPGSFNVPENYIQGESYECLNPVFGYFSFVTLTTLGYGDITPVSQAARNLTWMEALIGQLYLVITVAMLVGLRISNAEDHQNPNLKD